MMRKTWIYFLFFSFMIIPLGCASDSPSRSSVGSDPSDNHVELMVSAAASLTDALNELKFAYENDHPGVEIRFVFGSSGKLATQIEQGAPSDLFLSASEKDMDRLQEKSLIARDSRVDFANNALVLITNKDNPSDLTSFEDIDPETIGYFAIGETETVPVGRYTKAALQHLDLWERLEQKFVLASDVRQVLTYVESGNAEVGVVYATDAAISDRVQVIAEANGAWHDPIVYPGAVIAHTAHPVEAKAFLNYVAGERGKEILNNYGFK